MDTDVANRHQAGHRTDGDDAASSLPCHLLELRPHPQEDAAQVDVHDEVVLVVLHVGERLHDGDPGVVHREVEAAPCLDHPGDQLLLLVPPPDVTGEEFGFAARVPDEPHGLLFTAFCGSVPPRVQRRLGTDAATVVATVLCR
jgi:hypothetical protein